MVLDLLDAVFIQQTYKPEAVSSGFCEWVTNSIPMVQRKASVPNTSVKFYLATNHISSLLKTSLFMVERS